MNLKRKLWWAQHRTDVYKYSTFILLLEQPTLNNKIKTIKNKKFPQFITHITSIDIISKFKLKVFKLLIIY